jgi:hypothetical protein
MKSILISILLFGVTGACHAETLSQELAQSDPNYDTSWYVGVGLGAMHYRQSNINGYDLSDRRLIVGKQLSRAIAAEVHLGNSSSDTQAISGVPVSLKVNNYVAGFIKLNLTMESKDWNYNRFRLYGMLGGTRVDSTSTDPGSASSGVQTGIAGGVGMEFFIDNIAIQLGYTRYLSGNSNNQNYTLDSLHLGVIYQFGSQVANAK